MNTTPAVEIGQSYRVGTDLHTVTDTATALQGVSVYRTASNYGKTYAIGEFEAMVADGRAVLLVPADVAPFTSQSERRYLEGRSEIRADIERRAARIANVMSDWKGKEIVLASGRIVTVSEHRHDTVRLIRTTGPNAGDSAWYPAEEIWQGLENGTILTPDQLATALACREAVAMLDAMLTHPTRTPESIAYVARAALRILVEANGADSLSGLALAELDRRHPARPVTKHGGTWRLVNQYGDAVEIGEYATRDNRKFTITEQPASHADQLDQLTAFVTWQDMTGGAWAQLRVLADGWHWERVAA